MKREFLCKFKDNRPHEVYYGESLFEVWYTYIHVRGSEYIEHIISIERVW